MVFIVFEVISVDSFATALPMASISSPSSPSEGLRRHDADLLIAPTPNPPGPPGRPGPPPACAPIGGLPPGPAAACGSPLFAQPPSTANKQRAENISHPDTDARAAPTATGDDE
ncbi:MAG: hypothetical protein WDO68_23335 [Gammaproteobacteria bacterium]